VQQQIGVRMDRLPGEFDAIRMNVCFQSWNVAVRATEGGEQLLSAFDLGIPGTPAGWHC